MEQLNNSTSFNDRRQASLRKWAFRRVTEQVCKTAHICNDTAGNPKIYPVVRREISPVWLYPPMRFLISLLPNQPGD